MRVVRVMYGEGSMVLGSLTRGEGGGPGEAHRRSQVGKGQLYPACHQEILPDALDLVC